MKTTIKTEPAKNYMRFWRDGMNVREQDAIEIAALPGYDDAIGLLDNVIVLGWGADTLAKYNADGRPAFAFFRAWAQHNLYAAGPTHPTTHECE